MFAISFPSFPVYESAEPFPRGGIECRIVSVTIGALPLVVEYQTEISEELHGGECGMLALVPVFCGVTWTALREYGNDGQLKAVIPFVAGGELLEEIESAVSEVT